MKVGRDPPPTTRAVAKHLGTTNSPMTQLESSVTSRLNDRTRVRLEEGRTIRGQKQ